MRAAFNMRAWLWTMGLIAVAVTAAPFVVRWRIGAARELIEEKRIWGHALAFFRERLRALVDRNDQRHMCRIQIRVLVVAICSYRNVFTI